MENLWGSEVCKVNSDDKDFQVIESLNHLRKNPRLSCVFGILIESISDPRSVFDLLVTTYIMS